MNRRRNGLVVALTGVVFTEQGEITVKTMPTLVSMAVLLAGVGWAREASGPVDRTMTPDTLKAEVEALKPARHVWRAIDWKTCPLAALKASREQKKPIITWVFLGLPTDERC
jgi:hypothetical protein